MMHVNKTTLEKVLSTTVFGLALIVRFLNLGTAPLSDFEANWALQALEVAKRGGLNNQVFVGPQPAYIFLTGLLFEIFGSSNFLARFWPALAGALLVLVPLLLRMKIGRFVALIAAFGLALDPGLVTVSRQAGGPMMALGFLGLAIALWFQNRHTLAGMLAGLALLSGCMLVHGLPILGITLFITKMVRFRKSRYQPKAEAVEPVFPSQALPYLYKTSFWKSFTAAVLTVLFIGTSFMRFPQGLAGWIESLTVYLNGWRVPAETSPLSILAALVIYQPIALVYAAIGTGRWLFAKNQFPKDKKTSFQFALLWLLTALTLAMVYPAGQVNDLVWALVPLWVMAGFEFERYLPGFDNQLVSILQAILIFVLTALFWITLISTTNIPPDASHLSSGMRFALLAGILTLGILTALLIALGWSPEASRLGVAWGLTLSAAVYLISALWSTSQLRVNQPSELWGTRPGTGHSDLVLTTLKELSSRNTGFDHQIEILSVVDSPSLRWLLRDFLNARFLSSLSPSELPPVILTSETDNSLALTATYRGQDFVWRTMPDWTGALPDDLIAWLTFRQSTTRNEKIILWARSDQF